MSKHLQLIVLVVSALSVLSPAYAQDAPREPAVQDQPVMNAALKGQAAKDPAAREPAAKEPAAKEQTPRDQPPRSPAAKELVKGLDEQVQEIKTDVLSIAAQLNQLEEKLIYPSDTQIAVFVSLAKGEKFRLDAVDIALDGKEVAHHLYTFKELEALQRGGVQRIYLGNVRTGEHALKVTSTGKTEGGSDFQKEENFTVGKGVGPKLVGVVLAGTGIGSKPIALKEW